MGFFGFRNNVAAVAVHAGGRGPGRDQGCSRHCSGGHGGRQFARLGEAIGDPELSSLADKALQALRRLPALHGLYPSRMRPHNAGPASKEVGFGSGSDSFYEILLKRWLHGGRSQPWLRTMYRQSLHGLHRLLRRSDPSGLLFLARANGGEIGDARPASHRLRDAHTVGPSAALEPSIPP